MKLAFCLETLFADLPLVQRMKAVRDHGVENLELWDLKAKPIPVVQQTLAELKMNLVNFSGNRVASMIDPEDQDRFLKEVAESAALAKQFQCQRIMLLAQPLSETGAGLLPKKEYTQAQKLENLLACAKRAVAIAEEYQLTFVLEPLNSKIDHPDYCLDSSADGFAIIRQINHPRFKLLYDIYHMAVMGEDVLGDLEKHIDLIDHIHIADHPGRGEPGTGGVDYRAVHARLKELRYGAFVGFEFFPQEGNSSRALKRIQEVFARC